MPKLVTRVSLIGTSARARSRCPILSGVPRIGEPRAPARPATDDQENRRGAILAAAARLGATKEIDRIGAQEIAADAGVALRTLYRYYPPNTMCSPRCSSPRCPSSGRRRPVVIRPETSPR